MNVIDPARSKTEPPNRRQWRRRLIIATYSSYAAAAILTVIRGHAMLGAGARLAIGVGFGLSAITFIVSLVWLVGPSVRYGLGTRSYRQPVPGEFRRLRDQGVSARTAQAMFVRPADERQRAIREHAQAVSYRILGPVVGVVALYLLFARSVFDAAWLPSSSTEQVMLLAGLALLFSTLPSAVIAWSEPDPVPDDDAGGSR